MARKVKAMAFEDFRAHIGKRIRQVREAMEYSVSDLSMATGLPHPTIEKWEGGRACPRLDMLARLCVALECTVDELLP